MSGNSRRSNFQNYIWAKMQNSNMLVSKKCQILPAPQEMCAAIPQNSCKLEKKLKNNDYLKNQYLDH